MKSLFKINGTSKANTVPQFRSMLGGKSQVFPEFPSLFDDYFVRDFFNSEHGALAESTLPAVNVRETDSHLELQMAAPGMDKKDFKVYVEQGQLIISGQKENTSDEKTENIFIQKEFLYHSFKRVFNLSVDDDIFGEQNQTTAVTA